MEKLSSAALKQVLHYDPETGEFTWLADRNGGSNAGDRAGTHHIASGYRRLKVFGTLHKEHRLAWFYMTGEWPTHGIDHRNGVKDDNRWVNLREATAFENHQNRAMPLGKAGLVGAHRADCGWTSQIRVGGRHIYLGYFKTPEEASAAYVAAKLQHHEFQPIDRRQQ